MAEKIAEALKKLQDEGEVKIGSSSGIDCHTASELTQKGLALYTDDDALVLTEKGRAVADPRRVAQRMVEDYVLQSADAKWLESLAGLVEIRKGQLG